jgi:hypothetical protein
MQNLVSTVMHLSAKNNLTLELSQVQAEHSKITRLL